MGGFLKLLIKHKIIGRMLLDIIAAIMIGIIAITMVLGLYFGFWNYYLRVSVFLILMVLSGTSIYWGLHWHNTMMNNAG